MIFKDRRAAGRLLAAALQRLKPAVPVVLALPRGGVPVAFEIARALAAPLDVALVRKIGVPWQPELALGAIAEGAESEPVLNAALQAELQIPATYVREACARQCAEIARRRDLYRDGLPPVEIGDRTVIVVDDGIATGATMRAALRAQRRRHPRRLVLAVPVAAPESLAELEPEADEIVCLEAPVDMGAVGLYYRDFTQVSDADVVALLRSSRT